MAELASQVPSRTRFTLPERYQESWHEAFQTRVAETMFPGIRILDVGSGAGPAIPHDQRPAGCFYAGLDLSLAELQKAPPGSYDATHVSDIGTRVNDLEQQFDLIVSWQVLEHVKSLDDALENIHFYLKPGGRFLAQFSGTFSIFGLLNRVIPQPVAVFAMHKLLGRRPETVFPAYYHHCWHSAIGRAMSSWSRVDVVDRYRTGSYFGFVPPLRAAVVKFETWTMDRGLRNLASHYLVDARR